MRTAACPTRYGVAGRHSNRRTRDDYSPELKLRSEQNRGKPILAQPSARERPLGLQYARIDAGLRDDAKNQLDDSAIVSVFCVLHGSADAAILEEQAAMRTTPSVLLKPRRATPTQPKSCLQQRCRTKCSAFNFFENKSVECRLQAWQHTSVADV